MEAIEFSAAVNQVRTLADGGIRVVLDLPEDAIPQMAMLAECRREGMYLYFSATATDNRRITGNDRQRSKHRKILQRE